MAEAVSCDAGAITGRRLDARFRRDRRPQRAEHCARLHQRAEDLRRQTERLDQIVGPARVRGSSIWLVLASVNSLTLMPVKK